MFVSYTLTLTYIQIETLVLWFSIMAFTRGRCKAESSAMRAHKWFKYQF